MKKKLPTTPNIAPITIGTGQVDDKIEIKKETTEEQSTKIESRKQEYRKNESIIQDSASDDSPMQARTSTQKQKATPSDLPEKTKRLKTVTMRISNSAADVLKDLKEETGLPNEIITDALIRNWESLPKKLQKAVIDDAKKVRAWRLVEGKRKSLETAQRNNSF